MKIVVKKATTKNLIFFYKLRNEKKDRHNFFNTKHIKFNNHKKWFKKNLEKNTYLVCLYNKKKIGIIRYDIKKKIASISIIILKKYRNHGFGSSFLKKSEKNLKEKFKINKIAIVLDKFYKKENL